MIPSPMSRDFIDAKGTVRVYNWALGNYFLGDCMKTPHAHVLHDMSDVLIPIAGELRKYLRSEGFSEQTVQAATKYLNRKQRN